MSLGLHPVLCGRIHGTVPPVGPQIPGQPSKAVRSDAYGVMGGRCFLFDIVHHLCDYQRVGTIHRAVILDFNTYTGTLFIVVFEFRESRTGARIGKHQYTAVASQNSFRHGLQCLFDITGKVTGKIVVAYHIHHKHIFDLGRNTPLTHRNLHSDGSPSNV